MTPPRTLFARRGRRRAESDAGFTLIELMASLTLLAVGIVGVIGVMNSSFRVVGTATSRSKATAVATKYVEYLRSLTYKDVPVSTNVNDPYVTVSPKPGNPPTWETVGGQRFGVKYAVTWANEATPPQQGTATVAAYKKAVVWVSWNDTSGYHDVYQTTLIYPGGLGVFNAAQNVAPPGNSSTKPLKPKSVVGTPVTGTSSVDLVWVPPDVVANVPLAETWIVQYSRSSSFLPGEVQEVAARIPGSVTTLRLTDLAEGTTYHFRVYAKSASGVLSDTATQTATGGVVTGLSGASACSVGAASVTPSGIKKRGGNEAGGRLDAPYPKVEVQLLTTCTGTTFQMEYSPKDGSVETVALNPVASRPGTLFAEVNGDLNSWVVGDRPVDVYSYTAGVKKLRANLRLIVCDNNKATCP